MALWMFLISLLFLTDGFATLLPDRKEWDKSRAVILAKKLQKPAQLPFWMYPVKNEKLLVPDESAPVFDLDVPSAGDSSGDRCQDATIVIHQYIMTDPKNKKKETKIPIVISDLTNALVAEGGKCKCAEAGSTPVKIDGRMICIKTMGSLAKDVECIHTAECKEGFVCIFDSAKKSNGNDGDIEDTRRFCSGSGTLAPAALILLSLTSLVLSKLYA